MNPVFYIYTKFFIVPFIFKDIGHGPLVFLSAMHCMGSFRPSLLWSRFNDD